MNHLARYFTAVWAITPPMLDALAAGVLGGGNNPTRGNILSARRKSMPRADMHQNGQGGKTFVLPIGGTMTKYDQECGPIGTQTMAKLLAEADGAGYSEIVLEIDCGGGEADGTGLLAETVRNLQTPTRAVITGYCCSAAYWVASACTTMEATANTDMIGCIGTMMSMKDMRAKLEKEGIKIIDIFATASKDKNQEFAKALDGDHSEIVKLLDAFNNEFLGAVKANRPQVLEVALTGKTYTALEALGLGLIDRITTVKTKTTTTPARAGAKPNNTMKIYANINGIIGFAALGIFASLPEGPPALDLLEFRLSEYKGLEEEAVKEKEAAEAKAAALADENTKQAVRIAELEAELEKKPGAFRGAPVIAKGKQKNGAENTAEWEAALAAIALMPHSSSLANNPQFS